MKHLGRVSLSRELAMRAAHAEPGYADAKTDFIAALWRAWQDFVYQKKNELTL